MPTASRMTDPPTSQAAAGDHERTGQAQRQCDTCLEAVRRFPRRTAPEIGRLAVIDRYVLSRRLPDLRSAGLVREGEVRVCTVTGPKPRRMLTWEPCEPQRLANKPAPPAPPLPKLLDEWYERRGFFRGPAYPVRRDG